MKTKMILLLGTIAIGFNTLAQSPIAYISNYGEDYISVIAIQKKVKIADINTGNKPHGVAVSPDGNWIAVSNEGDNTVSIINSDKNEVMKTIAVGQNPHQLDFKDEKYLLIAIMANTRWR